MTTFPRGQVVFFVATHPLRDIVIPTWIRLGVLVSRLAQPSDGLLAHETHGGHTHVSFGHTSVPGVRVVLDESFGLGLFLAALALPAVRGRGAVGFGHDVEGADGMHGLGAHPEGGLLGLGGGRCGGGDLLRGWLHQLQCTRRSRGAH